MNATMRAAMAEVHVARDNWLANLPYGEEPAAWYEYVRTCARYGLGLVRGDRELRRTFFEGETHRVL